jgi:hypothetical protein
MPYQIIPVMPKPKASPRTIGTKRESSLHHSLKTFYAGPEGQTEKPVGSYVCDAVSGSGEIIEIQTGSFGPLKSKIRDLALHGPVRIIYPVIVHKTIELRETDSTQIKIRKSPRRGSAWDLFKVLLYAPLLPLIDGLTIELAMVDVLEKRIRDGRGSWRRGGVSIVDRELSVWLKAVSLSRKSDYRAFVPFSDEEKFTVRSLAEKTHIRENLARKAIYVLTKIGVVERVDKTGKAWVYRKKI